MIKRDSLKTLVVGLVGFEGRLKTDYGPLVSGYALASVPLLILFIVAVRSLTEGLSQGLCRRSRLSPASVLSYTSCGGDGSARKA